MFPVLHSMAHEGDLCGYSHRLRIKIRGHDPGFHAKKEVQNVLLGQPRDTTAEDGASVVPGQFTICSPQRVVASLFYFLLPDTSVTMPLTRSVA